MSQQRNSPPLRRSAAGAAANAIDDQPILDAAYDLLLAVGLRRLTMADIARQAAVSRATMYRKWPNVQAVLADLMTREFGRVAATLAEPPRGQARAALVEGVVQVVSDVRRHPLLRKIIEVDPELLLPYLIERPGTTTVLQLGLLEAYLRAGIADGSVGSANVALTARAVMLTAWSFVLTGPVVVAESDYAALDAELTHLLERYLAP